jgi:small subunit ribosomal protein S16
MGRKKRPFYRIVAADTRAPRDGRFIEEIGYYNPLTDPSTVEVKEERALYWLSQGAIPSDTVKNLLRDKGITLRFDLMKRGMAEEKLLEEMQKWEMLQAAKSQNREAKKAQKAKTKAQKKAGKQKEEETETAGETRAEVAVEASETPRENTEAPAEKHPAVVETTPETSEEKKSE